MPTLTQIGFSALRDICELRPGQATSTDVNNEILEAANEMLSEWAHDQVNVYYDNSGTPTILAAFPDLSTSFTFEPGYLNAIRKNLAVKILPQMKLYLKAQPDIDAVTAQATAAYQSLRGVGVVGVV